MADIHYHIQPVRCIYTYRWPVCVLLLMVYPRLSYQQGTADSGVKLDNVCNDFQDYETYIRHWQEKYPQEAAKMYPAGDVYCDTVAGYTAKDRGFKPNINFDIPFYGRTYKSLWVSPGGFIALDTKSSHDPISFMWLDSWPNPQYPLPLAPDPPFIAPFYAEAQFIRGPDEPAQLFHRVLDPRYAGSNHKRAVIEGMLEEISMNINLAVVGADLFEAAYGIIVTWYKVTFAANDCGSINCARNTYQAAIVTDGTDTYVVLSYFDMNWIGGGGDQNCNRMTGTSLGSPNCKPGHIGFNSGEGRNFYAVPYSGQDYLNQIDDYGGSNVAGRFYYKVSGDSITRGGCTTDSRLNEATWPTELFPNTGGMLGGTPVNVSGPCYIDMELVKCRFDDIVVDAINVDNTMRVLCVSPLLAKVGPIKLGVSTDGGNNFKYETDYVVVTPDHVGPSIAIHRQVQDWLNPNQIELNWTPRTLTPNPNERVNIKLYGYREHSTSGSPQGEWEELRVLSEDYSNTGVFQFSTDSQQCNYDQDGQKCTLFDVGAIQIGTLFAEDNPGNPRRIWTEVFPLGWYIKSAMTQDRGSDWVPYKCEVWYYSNDQDSSWLSGLDACPCTFNQVYADFGRFQPDPLCYHGGTGPTNCERHEGAKHCVLSVYQSSTGAGNECCYDDSDMLMYSGDTEYGSRPQRSHVWGTPPYQVPPKVPYLSHWVSDLVGFYYCCEWQSGQKDCYSRFLTERLTKSCHDYATPGQAAAFGDPHFKTFDGVFYTFNGFGEYWLMEVEGASVHGGTVDFKLHARFEQPANTSGIQIKGTYMTAVGMQLNNDYKVVVELNKGGFQKNLLIHINDYLLDLTPFDHRRQEFKDLIIINNDPMDLVHATNFTIIYRCGIGMNIYYNNGLLDLVVSAPPEFKFVTRGLLGKWNDDPNDDLESKVPGGPPFTPEETEKVHYFFGETWRVTNTESCFEYLYKAQLDHAYYYKDWFIPNFIPQFPPNNTDVTEEMVQAACNNDFGCTYDYKTTLIAGIGRDTKLMQEWDQERRVMAQSVLSCGWLSVPYSIKREPLSYLVGSQVTITGCVDGYTLEGPTAYNCLNRGDGTAEWSPAITTRCRGPGDPLPTTTVLAIAVPVALAAVLLIIAIVVIILVVRKKKKKKRQERESKQVYVPVFQEIIEWRKETESNPPPSESLDTEKNQEINVPKRKRAQSKEGLADFMGGRGADSFSIVPPSPDRKKPPRPDPNTSRDHLSFDDSIDLKHQYENKINNSVDSSGNHVSWDTQDGDKMSDNKPAKQSTLKSQKSNHNKETSPQPSPKAKKKRPYQYPSESRNNSQEDWRSNESPTLKIRSHEQEPVAMYRPRDAHSYSRGGHNIPTADTTKSDYYKRKYGRYNNT